MGRGGVGSRVTPQVRKRRALCRGAEISQQPRQSTHWATDPLDLFPHHIYPHPATPSRNATMSESPSEIQIHVKGENSHPLERREKASSRAYAGANELKLQITIKTDKTVQDLKHAIAEKTDAPADRQRLIYSGKVLKVRLLDPPRSTPLPISNLSSLACRLL